MAEEFQNTISLHGPLDAVEEIARLIGMAQPDSRQDILDG